MYTITVSHVIYFELLKEFREVNDVEDFSNFRKWVKSYWGITADSSNQAPDLFVWDLIFDDFRKFDLFKIKYSQLISTDVIPTSSLLQ